MNKIIYLLLVLLTLVALKVVAKVAYLPVTGPAIPPLYDIFTRDTIIVLNLETSQVLKKIKSPANYFNGSVFLNNSETKLYAAGLNQIITIDTTTLEIENILDVPVEINNDFGIPAQINEIFLNPQGDKLYYSSKFSGLLHQVDLVTNEITAPLDFVDEYISEIDFNESLNTLVISTESIGVSNLTFHVYDLNTLAEKYTNPAFTSDIQLISNDGEDYYYFLYSEERRVYSRKLSDNSVNWTFEFEGDRFFSVILENNDNSITVVGQLNTYQINKSTGEWFIESSFNSSDIDFFNFNSLKRLDDGSFFTASGISFVCASPPPPPPFPGCYLTLGMTANVNNINDQTIQLVFQSDRLGGTEVKGRFIGAKFFSVPVIPVVVDKFLLMFLFLLILLVAFKTQQLRRQ